MKMTIACGHFEAAPGDIARNTEAIDGLAARAAGDGASLLVLPELCLCGYLPAADAARLAVRADGPEVALVRRISRDRGLSIAFGFAERGAGTVLHNSMAFVDGRRPVPTAVYRKVHLWVTENSWAEPGGGFAAFDAGGARAGMWICYDTRFPEAARCLARAGATLALVGSAWFGPAGEWELALRARALDNGVFAAGAASQGEFQGAAFHGDSMVVDPHGTVIARVPAGPAGTACAEYDSAVVDAFRARLPLLSDLRPDAYG